MTEDEQIVVEQRFIDLTPTPCDSGVVIPDKPMTFHEWIARWLAADAGHWNTDEIREGRPIWRYYLGKAFVMIRWMNHSGYKIGPEFEPEWIKDIGGLTADLSDEDVARLQ